MRLVDSTFLIDILRSKKEVLPLIESNEELLTTQINMYEIIRGLYKIGISHSKLINTIKFFDNIKVLSLDDRSIIKSAEISSKLIKKGEEISDLDCIIAGIALSNGIKTIVTKNTKHFKKIKELKVESY